MGADGFAPRADGFPPLFSFLRLGRPLLSILEFFGEENFFLFRAVELPAKIIDLRLQIGGLRTIASRAPNSGSIRVVPRFFHALLQRNDFLLTSVQFGLQIRFFFLDLRQLCFRFCRSIFCFNDFCLLFGSGRFIGRSILFRVRLTALGRIARGLCIRGIRAKRSCFLDILPNT